MPPTEPAKAWKLEVRARLRKDGRTDGDLARLAGYAENSIRTWLNVSKDQMPGPEAAARIHEALGAGPRTKLPRLYAQHREVRPSRAKPLDWLAGSWEQTVLPLPVEWAQRQWQRPAKTTDSVFVDNVSPSGEINGTIHRSQQGQRGAERTQSWKFSGRVTVVGPSLLLIFTEDDERSTNGVIVLTLPTGDRTFLSGVYVSVQPAREGEPLRRFNSRLANHVELDSEIALSRWSNFAVPRPLTWRRVEQ